MRCDAKDVADRDGVPHAALVAVRGHDDHVAKVGHALHEVSDAWGSDAVVVGDENQGALRRVAHSLRLRGPVQDVEEVAPEFLDGADLHAFVRAVCPTDVGPKRNHVHARVVRP